MKKRIISVLVLLLCAFMAFGLAGCGDENIEDGGTTDLTDYNAPKEIKSKDIKDFSVTFCLAGEWTPGRESLKCDFKVKKNQKGELTASESTLGISVPAGKSLFNKIQKIIDKYKLVENNGVYRVTAGLAPECQKCSMTVNYRSGEKLTFTTNNDPYEKWAEEMYQVFADWFAENGDKSLPKPE